MLPFPIFLPIPIPIPIPVPIGWNQPAKVTEEDTSKIEVYHESDDDSLVDTEMEDEVKVSIKKEEDIENSPQDISHLNKGPEEKLNPTLQVNMANLESSNSDDESRRKRRAFIMDQ